MSKYIKREDADKTLCDLVREYNREARGLESSGAFEALSRIRLVPNADVALVKHGRWTWDSDGMDWGIGAWCCSECKFKAETWWANDKKYNPLRCSGGHFCGNCGAKMDGGGDV